MTTFEHLKKEVVPTIPHQPGIYKYFDKDSKLLYIGKAKDLRKRVASYFTKSHDSGKTRILVSKIVSIEITVVETEQDALLLENVMIKKLQPKYNIALKDDKTYPYICIKKERFPRIFFTRKVIKDGSEYLGPYTSVQNARAILDMLLSIFPIRTCTFSLTEKNIAANKFKVCLEYHIGNCKGPCAAHQTEEDYNTAITQIRKILRGNTTHVIRFLRKEMTNCAEKFDFEKAHEIKERVLLLEKYQSRSTIVNPSINNVDVFSLEEDEKRAYVSYLKVVNGSIIQTKIIELVKKLAEYPEELLEFGIHELRQQFESNSTEIIVPFSIDYPDKTINFTIPKIGDKKKLLDLARKNAFYYKRQREIKAAQHKKPSERSFELLSQLKKDLRLTELPKRIECFDNSNFQGTNPVASMVCFIDAKPANREYRHYHIKTVTGPDDFASMQEVVYRRYKRLLKEAKPLPQLIVIDGGKGQLNAAVQSLQLLGIRKKVAIIGIAKKLEEIYVPNDPYPLLIDKRAESLKVIQHLRNEAHRFAITFHRKLRSNDLLKSELEQIKGIGKKTAEKLLTHFKAIDAIKKASKNELQKVVTLKQATAIIAYFKE